MKRDLVVAGSVEPPAMARMPERWPELIEAMLDAVLLVDVPDGRIVAANHAASVLLGAPAHALAGQAILRWATAPEDVVYWSEAADGCADPIESETHVATADGTLRPVLRRATRVRVDAGSALFVVVLHDRSARLRVERDLEAAAADLRATLESTCDGILVVDNAGRIRNFNQRFAALWQVPGPLLVGRDDDAVYQWMRRSVDDPEAYMRRLAQIDAGSFDLEGRDLLRLEGGVVLERTTTPLRLHGRPVGRLYAFRDLTEKVRAERRIETLAHTDALTGLPNRRLLCDRFEMAVALARRVRGTFALLFVDLDGFGRINETLGRTVGDSVLLEVAERLKVGLRGADTIARLGADEFVLLAHQADEQGAAIVARRLVEALEPPFSHGGMPFTVTASLGVALYPADATTLDELLPLAETAMREAKTAGCAAVRFARVRPEADHRSRRSGMRIDHAMRLALVQGRFRLHYQPQVDCSTGATTGAEALIRWRDPELGDIAPGEFIPVAEQSGFIVPIGQWVLKRAIAQAAEWAAAGRDLVVSVNVSALQFRQPDFVSEVAGALRSAGLPPARIELELTESILLKDADGAIRRLDELATLGVGLAIDDFGTGYASLAYLKRLPVNRLKIDRSFITGLPDTPSDAAIVRAVIDMGRALSLRIVAEGVETEAQRRFLAAAGCDLYQGFLYAPALAVPAFERRIGPAEASTAP